MPWNLCTSGAAIAKSGTNANSTIVASGGTLNKWSDEVEGVINSRTRKNWITNAATTNFSGALSDVASDLIAMKIIAYDMSGYTSRLEAGTMMDFLRDNSERTIQDIMKKEHQDVMD